MPAAWAAGAAAVGTIGGAYLSGQAAKGAASTSADAQRYAADQAAEAARFKPYGVTTGFGKSNFGTDEAGNPTASYTLTPELQAIRNKMMSQAGAYDSERIGKLAEPLTAGATSLFNLGQQYLATSPEAAAQQYMQQQQGLLAPGREQQLAGLRNQQFQTGRTGLATGGTVAGGMQQTNPEMAAYYNSLAQTDKTLAAQADQYGQQRATYGAGLFNSGAGMLAQVPSLTTQGYGPLQTQLGLAGTIEGYGQSALDIGAQLGGRSATAGANVAQSLLTGGISAAKTQQAGNAYSPAGAILQGVGSNQALTSGFEKYLNNKQYDGWQTSGDNTYFGSNSSGQGSGSVTSDDWWM
jgi:hypothetical protein